MPDSRRHACRLQRGGWQSHPSLWAQGQSSFQTPDLASGSSGQVVVPQLPKHRKRARLFLNADITAALQEAQIKPAPAVVASAPAPEPETKPCCRCLCASDPAPLLPRYQLVETSRCRRSTPKAPPAPKSCTRVSHLCVAALGRQLWVATQPLARREKYLLRTLWPHTLAPGAHAQRS